MSERDAHLQCTAKTSAPATLACSLVHYLPALSTCCRRPARLPAGRTATPAGTAAAASAGGAAAPLPLPPQLDVVCNELRGRLDTATFGVAVEGSPQLLDPKEFEAQAGRSTSKHWQVGKHWRAGKRRVLAGRNCVACVAFTCTLGRRLEQTARASPAPPVREEAILPGASCGGGGGSCTHSTMAGRRWLPRLSRHCTRWLRHFLAAH